MSTFYQYTKYKATVYLLVFSAKTLVGISYPGYLQSEVNPPALQGFERIKLSL